MRRWGGIGDSSPVVPGTPFDLRVSVVGSLGVDEVPLSDVCRFGEDGRGKSRDSVFMLRIMGGPRLLGDAAWKGA